MLNNLIIKNFATIKFVDINFFNGFSVLTGQTGSGKSIIIGALNLISGSRADFSKFYDNSKKIIIEAHFDISDLNFSSLFSSNDIDYESELIIRREILPNGKSRSFINDSPVRLEVLRNFSLKIIDIHSQHENLLLNNEFFQLNFIDTLLSFENKDYNNKLTLYQKKFSENQKLSQKIDQFELNNKLQSDELENLKKLHNELKIADLKIGEKKEISEQFNLLKNIFEIKKNLSDILYFFQGENKIVNSMEKSNSLLKSISSYNDKLLNFSNRLSSNLIDIKDLYEEINIFQDRLIVDNNLMNEIEERLNLINSLEEKHFVNSEEKLLEKTNELSKKISLIKNHDYDLIKTKEEFIKNNEWLLLTSKFISKSRIDFSKKIESLLIKDLEFLGISNGKLKFVINELDSLNYHGKDSVELLFSANKGHELKEIHKIASGGELSRLMLCIKKHLYSINNSSTIIFDEIDSGVSGKIAEKVGFFMKQISSNQQIIAITHLPQIASLANNHYKVFKTEKTESKTETSIMKLNAENRVYELARLLSGREITEEAIANAEKMLNI
ncbi:MAG: DNA repair protein RecN [Flavobacteriales bacterium]|nr:DNA repair protein RecN [Flavobacteriales bacterium]